MPGGCVISPQSYCHGCGAPAVGDRAWFVSGTLSSCPQCLREDGLFLPLLPHGQWMSAGAIRTLLRREVGASADRVARWLHSAERRSQVRRSGSPVPRFRRAAHPHLRYDGPLAQPPAAG